jgi:CRISPR/Cas system-associated protein Csm6
MTLREQIVREIMSLVRQPAKKMEKPSIAELEKILNSESTDNINIEPDGSISVTPTSTTVGAVADRVVVVVEAEIGRLRHALTEIAQFAPGNGDVCEQIAKTARRALYPELNELDQ